MTYIQKLDWLCCILTLIGLYLVPTKPIIGWVVYTLSNILYTYLMYKGKFVAMGFLGIGLTVLGVINIFRSIK